ncbi:hypothetical protein CROQUDRAFT_35929 [Cronartium quercuum f. sp. fusiforme G11]|uniref:Rhomboid-type serine protease n=1 Tax=Cronartium quercuum f. sp. fusiforme G11 TaxID=708437 RepID=A0A9P6NTU9_9BASI|nr:hypothetical protein CROQUDRAFT_35929 [Cronartium quercuum f. sp. fusiforme G11]
MSSSNRQDSYCYPHNNPYADSFELNHHKTNHYQNQKQPDPSYSNSSYAHQTHHHHQHPPTGRTSSLDSIDQATIAESSYLAVRDKDLIHHNAYEENEDDLIEKPNMESYYHQNHHPYYINENSNQNQMEDIERNEIKYPPTNHMNHNETHDQILETKTINHKRPPVWKRIFWDTTPLDHRIWNHQQGIGVQDRAYICYLLAIGMLIALILELVTNYQGTLIATKPSFNYMIGPSAEILINTGARFTPCIRYVPGVSNISFPCLNETSSTPTCSTPLENICGFGGFKKPGEPDQTFRLILPMFLHAGLVHYVINMLVQMTSSALIERQMGSIRFLLLYIPSGVFGFILGGNFSLVGQPSVGASGAIFSTHAAVLVDLIAHWSIEDRPGRKLGFLLFEIIAGLALGLIPGIDNFSHIGGFSMGLLLSGLLYPVLHQTRLHRLAFALTRTFCTIGALVMFIVLYKNFFTSDPAASCDWCRYLSCWPTKANNQCKGTGLGTTETTVVQGSNTVFFLLVLLAPKLVTKLFC